MSKKKKTKNDLKVNSKPIPNKLKSINKYQKAKVEKSKIKNKKKVKNNFTDYSSNTRNVINNRVFHSKNKHNFKKKNSLEVDHKQNTKQNNTFTRKKNKAFQKLNVNNSNKNFNKTHNSLQDKFSNKQKGNQPENKKNIKNSIKFKSKNKFKKKFSPNSNNQQNLSQNNSFVTKKNESLQNVDRNNSNKKYGEQQSLERNTEDNSQSLKDFDLNKLNAMLHRKEKEDGQISKKKKNRGPPLPLRERMLAQLKASRFRFLNEQMYSNDSKSSKKYFQEDPQAFYAYHEGYKQQVERWPVNPLDVIIESIKKMPKDYIIADFGCGEAKLADSVPQTVNSFDLVAVNDKVQACDMANTPLLTGRVNVVVFCLSLMGSNLGDYLLEANRVLVKGGILKIAEVESRFYKIEDFIKLLDKYGFINTWKDLSHNLFYFMDFKKTKDVLKKDVNKLPTITLKPCLYKKR